MAQKKFINKIIEIVKLFLISDDVGKISSNRYTSMWYVIIKL